MSRVRLPIALQQAVMHCLRDKLLLANQRLDCVHPEPAVHYQQRGTTAGSAWLQQWQIRLNPTLLLENGDSFIQQVVPHELAHLLAYKQFGRVAPHGREWRWMMEQILDVPAERTHHFTTQSVQGQTFTYVCACQQHELTLRRHNRIIRQQSEYRCCRCKAVLQPYRGVRIEN